MLRDEKSVLGQLELESGLSRDEAEFYLNLLRTGHCPLGADKKKVTKLLDRGMIILSGDNKMYVPVHPRLAIANQYRTWRERMVRDINERRMRVDRLILELIPVYEATMEKKLSGKR